MLYYSTNKKSKLADFKTALLEGLAFDGGLYMPENFPRSKNFQEAISKFVNLPAVDLKKICDSAFNFPVPLVKLDENLYILELFHGPTLSFKDFGARFMARMMNYYLSRSGEKLNIIVATSGDTGSAVASGFYGLSNIKVFVLYPSKRISELQEKQITTLGKNIVALEVRGDFDDCQRLAKTVLVDPKLREKVNLSSANSINIGRLLPQMYYYFSGYERLKKLYSKSYIPNPIFVVPSGNFGNLTAGLFAKKIGLPIKKFIAAVNKNSVVPNFLETGKLKSHETEMTISNAMDVGNPSNWARIRELYDYDHDDDDNKIRANLKKDIEAITVSEAETRKTIADFYKKYGYVIDPHTAVGIASAQKSSSWSRAPLKSAGFGSGSSPFVVLATAHPAKFKNIVEKEIVKKIFLPKQLSTVSKKSPKSIFLSKNYMDLKNLILDSSY